MKVDDYWYGCCAGVELVWDEDVDGNVVGGGPRGQVENDGEGRVGGETEEGIGDCSRETDEGGAPLHVERLSEEGLEGHGGRVGVVAVGR